jgi:hypothetical protein
VAAVSGAGLTAAPAAARPPLVDAPVLWHEDDRHDSAEPAERDPNLLRDQLNTTVLRPVRRATTPSRLVRRVGTLFGGDHVRAAGNVNTLDEVPNSTWFTNRIGLFPLSPEEAARGPCAQDGPSRDGPWTIVSAKTEGVTPGFNIRDARGDTYLIKFDPPGYLGLTTGAGAIAGRILHAAGYNVPEDAVVRFRRERLVLGDGVKIKEDGVKRSMTEADIEAILERVDPVAPGEYLAISSKFLSGRPVGPFDYRGRRDDDPNDRLDHQHRRELRGLRLLAAWLLHFDTKQGNTLDMYVEEDGRRFVKHYLIDFASTLGAGAHGPTAKYGREYGFDLPQIFARLFAVGLHEDDWRRVRLDPELPEIGFFDTEHFDPKGFKPLTPNSAFAHLTDRDGYWAAKIISAFTDRHLRAICETGRFRDPATARGLAKRLAARRDLIAREWFRTVVPLDFFRVEGNLLRWADLGVERGVWPVVGSRYRVRCTAVDAERRAGGSGDWCELGETTVDEACDLGLALGGAATEAAKAVSAKTHPFLAFEVAVDRGDGWSDSVTAYVARASGRVVAVER